MGQRYMKMEDCFIRTIKLPGSIKGVTCPHSDGTYSVYINSNLSESCTYKTLKHELRHIEKDHFYDDTKSIEAVEAEAEQEDSL